MTQRKENNQNKTRRKRRRVCFRRRNFSVFLSDYQCLSRIIRVSFPKNSVSLQREERERDTKDCSILLFVLFRKLPKKTRHRSEKKKKSNIPVLIPFLWCAQSATFQYFQVRPSSVPIFLCVRDILPIYKLTEKLISLFKIITSFVKLVGGEESWGFTCYSSKVRAKWERDYLLNIIQGGGTRAESGII